MLIFTIQYILIVAQQASKHSLEWIDDVPIPYLKC